VLAFIAALVLAEYLLRKDLGIDWPSLHIWAYDSSWKQPGRMLRTPLNAIIGFTGTLLMKLPGPLNPDQEKQLRTVQTGANHLLSLINDLLDLAKIEAGKVKVSLVHTDCMEVIDEVAASLRAPITTVTRSQSG